MNMTWVEVNLFWSAADTPEFAVEQRLKEDYDEWRQDEMVKRHGHCPQYLPGVARRALIAVPDLHLRHPQDWERLWKQHADADVRTEALRICWSSLESRFLATDLTAMEWRMKLKAAKEATIRSSFENHPMTQSGVVLDVRSMDGARRKLVIGSPRERLDEDEAEGISAMMRAKDVVVRYMDLRPAYQEDDPYAR